MSNADPPPTPSDSAPNERRPLHERHLLEFAGVRDVLVLVAIIAVLLLLFSVRAWITPLIVGFAAAYVFDPLCRWLKDNWRVPRLATTTVLVLLFIGLLVAGLIWFLPLLVEQLLRLMERVPDYIEITLSRYAPGLYEQLQRGEAFPATLPSGTDSATMLQSFFDGVGHLLGAIGSTLTTAFYIIGAFWVFLASFIGLSMHFGRLTAARELIPRSQRDSIWDAVREIDAAFSAYIRGQLAVALFTTIGFCVGFWLADVPSWFVVALVGGSLSIIPYGQTVGVILAVLLKFLEAETGDADFSWMSVVVYPGIVYLITQTMESWVITPLVQGEAAKLHPLTILIVLVIGGGTAGIAGLVLAIPITATVRTLARRSWIPRWRAFAERH